MRGRLLAAVVLLVPGLALGALGTAPLAGPAAAVASASQFVPVSPTRLLDTRTGLGAQPPGKPGDGGTVTLQVTGRSEVDVPAGATAVVLNVTATEATGPGFVTVFPGPSRPLASNLNLEQPGQTIPNLVTVPLGPGGRVLLYVQTSVHLVADVFGYYLPAPDGLAAAGRLVAIGPDRAFDSRSSSPLRAGGTVRVPLPPGVASDAAGVVLNVTVTDAAGPGFWTVWPAGLPRPGTSNLNVVAAGQTIPNQVIVPVSPAGIDVFTQTGGHVVVDVAGWFTGPSAPRSADGLFVPVSPTRLLDTREGGELNPLGARVKLFAGWTVEVPLAGRAGIPANASAVAVNATVVSAKGPGFVTAWAAGLPRPNASSLNATARRQTIANHVISPAGTRGLSLYTQSGAHLLADVTGYFTGPPRPSRLAPTPNPPPPAPEFPGRIVVPRLGLDASLQDGVDLDTLQFGPGWWPGTALPGQPGQLAVFGHRTSGSHPFRYIDGLRPGDDVYLVFDDMTYQYRVDGADVVGENDFHVLDARPDGSPSMLLAACHPPGSTDYRWVVHAAYVGSWGA